MEKNWLRKVQHIFKMLLLDQEIKVSIGIVHYLLNKNNT
jgi:hypothetical protein